MAHTKELTESITIQEDIERSGNNINLGFSDNQTIVVLLDSTYKIKRVGDTAFIKSNFP